MPKGLRKFNFSFNAKGLTRYGGILLFQRFCKFLALRRFLQRSMNWPRYDHLKFQPVDMFLAHLYAIIAGIGRIENTQTLAHNGLLPPLLGLPNFPHRKTLRDFLHRFDKKSLENLQAVHDKLRAELFGRMGLLYSAIIDCDTTVLTVFGNQESTEVGYNRKYRGKRSYAPILSSEGKTGLSLGMELRAGNVAASTGALIFLRQMLGKLPSSIAASRTRLRLDGAFYDKDILLPLERDGYGYVSVATMTGPLIKAMVAAKYHEFAQGWEAAEFTYTPWKWNEEHRFAVVRRPSVLESDKLKESLFTLKKHTYHRALVHNLALEPESVWRSYTDRANQELLIREFKDSFFMAKIPTRSFWANAAYMEMILWAYDLAVVFQMLCLPPEVQQWNIATLRRELWWLPAEWVRTDNRNWIRLPRRYPNQKLFEKIFKAAGKIKPLI